MLWKTIIISLVSFLPIFSCPENCVCENQSIDCSSRKLKTLPRDLPNEIISHETVSLSNQPIKINGLILANNEIEELPATLLSDKLPQLQSLDLSNNTISEVKRVQSIVLSKELLYFKVSYNPIRNLGYNIDNVLYSQSISHLDFSYCAISSITSPVSFMYMLNLTYLDLSGNPLVVIDHLVSNTLIHLDVSNCLLGDRGFREESFSNVPSLLTLNLSMNAQLTRLPSSTPLSVSVLHLDASYCAFEKVDLSSFPNLKNAILRGNIIKVLHDSMLLENLQLQSLDISENSIHHIEMNAFVGNNSLNKLDLSFNLLSSLDWNVFSPNLKLIYLNVSRNLLTALEDIPILSLMSLDVSRNEIFKLSPRFLSKAQSLRFLNLSHNAIEKLPKRLSSRKLMMLNLSFCRLFDIQYETFKELPSLISLNLMGNRLTIPLTNSFFDQLGNLKELYVTNNPWHCDCNDLDLRKFRKNSNNLSQVKIDYLKSLICNSPKEYSGVSLEENCFENLVSDSHALHKSVAWFSFLVPFLTLCCLLAIIVVIRQAYTCHAMELQDREATHQRSNNNAHSRQHTPRVPAHFFDDDLERGIQMSVNESTQRSSMRELTKLPSYEEALLLPKPQSREDLQKIVKNYEDNGRFERPLSESVPSQSSSQENAVFLENDPSTSNS